MIKENSKAVILKEGIKMKKRIGLGSGIIFGLMAMFLLLATPINAANPQIINIQGVVKAQGNKTLPTSDTVNVEFWGNQVKGTTPITTYKVGDVLIDEGGYFNIPLTVDTSITPFDIPYYIVINFANMGKFPATGRQPLLAVPYAFTAQNGVDGFNVQGQMKLAAVDVTKGSQTPGTMCFDSTAQRMMYRDDTQWIQIDPAYTTKSVKTALMVGGTNLNTGQTTFTFDIPEISKGIILTGISGRLFPNATDSFYDISVSNNQQTNSPIANFSTFTHYAGGEGYFNFNLPIPVKFVGGDALTMTVTPVTTGGSSFYFYRGYIQYIPLPL